MADRERAESGRADDTGLGEDTPCTEALLERIRTLRLWADHLESLLAKRTDQVAVWRDRAEKRKAAMEALRAELDRPKLSRRLRRRRSRPLAAANSGAQKTSTPAPLAEPSPAPTEARPVHPTVRLAVLTGASTPLPPLFRRMNSRVVTDDGDLEELRQADVLVVLGSEGRRLTELDEIREWISQRQPTVMVGEPNERIEGHVTVPASDLDYFDERDDVFTLEPVGQQVDDLDPDLHPTLIRLQNRPHLLSRLSLAGASADADERLAVARLRDLRAGRSPGAVAGRLIRAAGLTPPVGRTEALAVITSRRPDFIVGAVESLSAQTYRPLRIGVTLHGEAASAERRVRGLLEGAEIPHQVLLRDADRPQGACLNDLVGSMPGDVVLKIDDDDLYSPVYVEDMVTSLEYSGAPILGKGSAFYRLRNGRQVLMRGGYYGPTNHVIGSTITVRRHVWEAVRFPHRHERVDSKFLQGATTAGFGIVSQHPWDFCVIRHPENTWGASDRYFEATGRPVELEWDEMHTAALA